MDAQAGDGAGDTDAVAADASRDYLPDEEPAPDTGDAGYDELPLRPGNMPAVTRRARSSVSSPEPPSKADTARLEAPPRRATAFSITAFRKDGGPLTKRITLADDGKVKSDGSDCLMTRGTARAVHFTSLAQIGEFIGALQGDEAIALGTLRGGLPEEVRVTTKRRLNGSAGVIARTGDNIPYREGKPALALIDYDIKGMPPAVAERMTAAGGFWPALLSVLPELETVGRVSRSSTSTGLFRADTGEKLEGSGGQHVYLLVRDGADVDRFLRDLHARCWLAGYGWMMVGAGGQLLERSIVDRMVGAPERLVFEGAPVLEEPLRQNQDLRRPVVVEGEMLDTPAACPPLSVIEKARLLEMCDKEKARLAGEVAAARSAFIAERKNTYSAQCQCNGVLLPDVTLPFDDHELAGATVGDVLENPARFEGATLADPLEGVDYDRCKAKIMQRTNGEPWINSFAHGRTVYELNYNSATLRAKIEAAGAKDAPDVYARLMVRAQLTHTQKTELRAIVAARSNTNKKIITELEKEAQAQAKHDRAKEERIRQRAAIHDRRSKFRPRMRRGFRRSRSSRRHCGAHERQFRRCATWRVTLSRSASGAYRACTASKPRTRTMEVLICCRRPNNGC